MLLYFSNFLNNKHKMYDGPCASPCAVGRARTPQKFIYLDIFWT